MNFSSHAKAGLWVSTIVAGANFLIKSDLKFAGLAGLLTFTGSVLPDLDTDSIPSRWAARFGLALTAICLYTHNYFPAVVAGLLFFAVKSCKHRGPTHKYYWPVLFIGLSFYFGNFLYGAFGVGLLCHFIADGLSPLDSRSWI